MCGEIYGADVPEGIGGDKYDESGERSSVGAVARRP
jgi:hypothetical protein